MGNAKSISIENLNVLVRNELPKISFFQEKTITSHIVREYILNEKKSLKHHPNVSGLFSNDAPEIILTYEWSKDLVHVCDCLRSEKLVSAFRATFGDSAAIALSFPLDFEKKRIWIDILFVDQLARDIKSELKLAEDLYSSVKYHVALLSDVLLTRCWCLFEIAVRARSVKNNGVLSTVYVSDLSSHKIEMKTAQSMEYDFFNSMQATEDDDKKHVKASIIEVFKSEEEFNKYLNQIHDYIVEIAKIMDSSSEVVFGGRMQWMQGQYNRQASTQSRRAALERIDKEIRLAQLELAELM